MAEQAAVPSTPAAASPAPTAPAAPAVAMIAPAAPSGPRPGIAPSPSPVTTAPAPAAPQAPPPTAPTPAAAVTSTSPEATGPPVAPPPATEAPKTLLGAALAPPPPEAAPAEAPKAAEAAPTAPEATETPALPTFEAFTLPEGFQADPAKLADLQKELGEFEVLTKADHGEVQKLAQRLVDRHVTELQDTVKRITDAGREQVESTVAGWRTEWLSNPEWGGDNRDATVQAAMQFVRTFGGTPDEQQRVFSFLDKTGLGDHLLILSTYARAMKMIGGEGTMLAAAQPVPDKLSNVQKLYGTGSRRR